MHDRFHGCGQHYPNSLRIQMVRDFPLAKGVRIIEVGLYKQMCIDVYAGCTQRATSSGHVSGQQNRPALQERGDLRGWKTAGLGTYASTRYLDILLLASYTVTTTLGAASSVLGDECTVWR